MASSCREAVEEEEEEWKERSLSVCHQHQKEIYWFYDDDGGGIERIDGGW